MNIQLIDLPKITDPTRGSLTVVENNKEVPFDIKRAYWTYDVPAGEWRGGHAHKKQRELILAVSGCFTLSLDDGTERKDVLLNHPYQAILVNDGIWRELHDFSSGAVCLVLTEEFFDEEDYIRDYQEFIEFKKNIEL